MPLFVFNELDFVSTSARYQPKAGVDYDSIYDAVSAEVATLFIGVSAEELTRFGSPAVAAIAG